MKHFWIIDNKSSTTIFYRNYSDQILDPDLVSGLLSALHQFSQIELKQSGIESINMGGYKWVYRELKDYNILFIATDEKGTDVNVLHSRLDVITNTFVHEFDLSPSKWAQIWQGDTSLFKEFFNSLDKLIIQWQEAEKVENSAEIYDMLGIFQQIFNLFINIINRNFSDIPQRKIIQKMQSKLNELKEYPEYKRDKELLKIAFLEENGWNLITLNPAKLPIITLERFLLKYTTEIKDIMLDFLYMYKKASVGTEKSETSKKSISINALSDEVIPFLLNNWSLLKKLNLEKKILTIFLMK